MARTRSKKISESAAELEELRRSYHDRPEGQRLLFLQLLAENERRTIAEAARKASISERRGRYWWDAYRKGGLRGILDRRSWGSYNAQSPDDSTRSAHFATGLSFEDSGTGASWIAFVSKLANAVGSSRADDVGLKEVKSILEASLPGVDVLGVNLQVGLDVHNPGNRRNTVTADVSLESGGSHSESTTSLAVGQPHEQFINRTRKAGFPFSDFHDPHPFDFFLEPGKRRVDPSDALELYVGSFVLLARRSGDDVPQETLDLVERLRPFFAFLLTDILMRQNLRQHAGAPLYEFVRRISDRHSLTAQESSVLTLGFLGRSYKEMASQMAVSVSTIQTHVRSLFRKTGVSKMSELHARFYSEA